MLFLDIEVPTPTIPPSDSIRAVTENIIKQATTDPESFWHGVLDSAIHFGLKVLVAFVIYLIGAWLIKRVKRLLVRVFERRHTERTLAPFISSLVSITLTVLLVLATIGTLGVDTTSFAALLTAGGMAIGMALSGTVQNFAGGIMLLIFRPFKAGDFVTASGVSGTVMEVTIVSTKVLTPDNRVVVLPNGALFSSNIENVSAQPLRRVNWTVSVEYGSDAEKCMEVLLEIVRSDKRILTSADQRPKLTLGGEYRRTADSGPVCGIVVAQRERHLVCCPCLGAQRGLLGCILRPESPFLYRTPATRFQLCIPAHGRKHHQQISRIGYPPKKRKSAKHCFVSVSERAFSYFFPLTTEIRPHTESIPSG